MEKKNEGNANDNHGCLKGVLQLGILGLVLLFIFKASITALIFSSVFIVIMVIIGIYYDKKIPLLEEERKVKEQKDQDAFEEFKSEYQFIKVNANIPTNAKRVTYLRSGSNDFKLVSYTNEFIAWRDTEGLHLFPEMPDRKDFFPEGTLRVFTITVDQIEYFAQRGEMFRENKISGGGGGGSSLAGAVIGGLVAGGVGAVIGSRKKVNEVKSELITHDTRETFINFFIDGKKTSLFFDLSAFQVFNDLIPEKEYNIVSALKTSHIIRTQQAKANKTPDTSSKSVSEQIRELGQLRDDGLLSETEFAEKKKQLLDKIS